VSEELLGIYYKGLSMAIQKEQESQAYYGMARDVVENEGLKEFFEWLISEEVRHEGILTEFRDKMCADGALNKEELRLKGYKDYGIGKYLVQQELSEDVNYQDSLIIAMKREEGAAELFGFLAETTQQADLKELYEKLREEEIGHLRKLEATYDDEILGEN